jgi:hypothetical protein
MMGARKRACPPQSPNFMNVLMSARQVAFSPLVARTYFDTYGAECCSYCPTPAAWAAPPLRPPRLPRRAVDGIIDGCRGQRELAFSSRGHRHAERPTPRSPEVSRRFDSGAHAAFEFGSSPRNLTNSTVLANSLPSRPSLPSAQVEGSYRSAFTRAAYRRRVRKKSLFARPSRACASS